MKKSPSDQKLEQLEAEFQPLLLRCLKECAEQRRWGLFGQNRQPEAEAFLKWEEAAQLRRLALEIRGLRSRFGVPNPTAEKFLELCDQRGENLPGEPKRAAQFLQQLESLD